MPEEKSYPTFDGFNDDGTFSMEKWKAFWNELTESQQQRIRDKARWEGCTLGAVLWDWPSILEGVE